MLEDRGTLGTVTLEALFDSAPDGILIVDGSGRIVRVNPEAERLFGYPEGKLLGRAIEMLLPERFRTSHLEHCRQSTPGAVARSLGSGVEFMGLRADGTEFSVDISLAEIDTNGDQLVAAIVRDATERQARAALERDRAIRGAVLSHVIATGEEERRRIAEVIHDDPIQVMTAAGMQLQILRRSLDDPDVLERLGALEGMIQLSISALRQLIFELRPPVLDDEGLGPAVRTYLKEIEKAPHTVSFSLDDRMSRQPAGMARVLLYRAAQELVTNVRRHAAARHAFVTLGMSDGGFYVRVADDGDGFTADHGAAPPEHLGLASLREQAELAGGRLVVDSAPGKGTAVECWIEADGAISA